MARDGIEGLEALDEDDDGLVDMDGDGVEDVDIEELEEAAARDAEPADDLDDMADDADEAEAEVEGLTLEEPDPDELEDLGEDSVDLAQDPVTDEDKGEVLRTVDTTGDGYSDVTIYDRDGDAQGDFVEGDINNDGFEDIRMVDTDGDGESELTQHRENYGLLSDSAQERIDTIDLDKPELDSDRDGLTNIEEHDAGLNPVNADADNDNISDGAEVNQGSDPTDFDSYRDAGEVAWETGLEVEHEADMAAAEVEGFADDAGLDLDTADLDVAGVDAGGYDAGGYDDGGSAAVATDDGGSEY